MYGDMYEMKEMYGKSNMETYITTCKTDSQWEFVVWLRKLKQGLCINLEELSLLFNMLSRLVITFLPGSKRL